MLSWYWQEVYTPAHEDEVVEDTFDPFDKDYVFDAGLEATEPQ